MSDTQRIDGIDYEVIAEQGDGGGDYEWTQISLIRRPDGQLFYVDDGGCSCNGPWENVDAENLTPVATWTEAVELAKDPLPTFFSEADVYEFAAQLAELRPAPSPREVSRG